MKNSAGYRNKQYRHISAKRLLILWLAMAVACCNSRIYATTTENVEIKKNDDTEHRQIEQKKARVILLCTIAVVISLFLAILLITIVRIGRYNRRLNRLGKKAEPTEYIDAWSKYRLEEDAEKPPRDES